LLATVASAFTTTCVPAGRAGAPYEPQSTALIPLAAIVQTPSDATDRGPDLRDDTTPVVLVVLDGVRWQEVFSGVDSALSASHHLRPTPDGRSDARALLPSLYEALDARGAALGAPGHGTIAASGPNFVSLPGYTEIFAGHPADACHDNDCAGATGPTLVDAFRDRAARDADVAVIASWGPIGRAATTTRSRIVLSTGRQDVSGEPFLVDDPLTRDALARGARADARPGHDTFRPDRYTAELALRYLDAKRPSFLFVGLGEADEYAHQDDYAGYLGALRTADAFFGELFAALDRMGERGRRTLVLVTADHGRARDYRDHGGGLPESARVWLLAIGGPVRARGLVDVPFPRHLADIAPTIRQVSGLPPEAGAHTGAALTELLVNTPEFDLSRR
jgi:hypothetical protein